VANRRGEAPINPGTRKGCGEIEADALRPISTPFCPQISLHKREEGRRGGWVAPPLFPGKPSYGESIAPA